MVQIQAVNYHVSIIQFPLCCKAWIKVEHQVIFLLNNQVKYLPWFNANQETFSQSY